MAISKEINPELEMYALSEYIEEVRADFFSPEDGLIAGKEPNHV